VICGRGAALSAVGHELNAGGHANGTDSDPNIVGDEPAAFLTLTIFVFGVDGEDAVLAKPVAADDGDFFDVASVAEEFAALVRLGIGEVDQDRAVVWVGGCIVEGGLPEEACASGGLFWWDILFLANGDRGGIGWGDRLDNEVGFAGFVGAGVEVVDFAGGEPGAFAFGEEVVHGAGMRDHECIEWFVFLMVGGLE